jgi:hypothetical protein
MTIRLNVQVFPCAIYILQQVTSIFIGKTRLAGSDVRKITMYDDKYQELRKKNVKDSNGHQAIKRLFI